MRSLTTESLQFIQEVKGKSSAIHEISWNDGYTRLFEDFYAVIKDVADNISGLKIGSWKLDFSDNNASSSALTYIFNLGNNTSKINLQINPMKNSYIDLACPNLTTLDMPEALHKFYKSSAYKRYFENHSKEGVHLRALIPPSQIGSRHLGDYILHLINMMSPVICLGEEMESKISQAA